MNCKFAKTHALPMVFRVSSQSKCSQHFQSMKTQLFSNGFHPICLESLNGVKFRSLSGLCCHRTTGTLPVLKPINFSTGFHSSTSRFSRRVNPRNLSGRVHLRNTLQAARLIGTRNFSNGSRRKAMEGSRGAGDKKTFPWIAAYNNKKSKGLEKLQNGKTSRSSWEESADVFLKKNGGEYVAGYVDGESRAVDMMGSRRSSPLERDESVGIEENDAEIDSDPRWNKIRSRYRKITEFDSEAGLENPDLRRWNKQENWGRKTWKEATPSTIPKMVGEAVYGVGPVLAALSAGTREFYALHVQEGLDLSSNNRKKKDKKGFEKVLKIAERIGLTITQSSKHDLNMVVDNRPHQGLVLDASPLEMISIRELDPVSVEEEKGPLWVALDEVMDPQNLGAIIRSAYFFGATGVVLCAKNSAPLSGVVSKASAGSLELMELRCCKNMMQFLTSSVENGWRVLGGSVSSKAVPLNEVLPGAPTVLVLGSEGTGLRPLVERSCTQLIRIPGNILPVSAGRLQVEETEIMDRGCSGEEFQSFLAVESLNVSVAAGVLLHYLAGSNINNHNSH
ncbi:rRNA methyltransferase 1, mitochondrial [Macadamia integrifolia]|uniref:rRNA methyltransferase 1, mitochondrial n=1 Tax=Macadamia integrifolia TaxID=60698 RepID=UPI001C4EB5B7|nr:rRNA methyltransferase 1, mitochondrial [Macadamia integrifolia]XP_042490627.1 rRNA methyltransferase 1, mitochondrial [Macadamia integrifolia]